MECEEVKRSVEWLIRKVVKAASLIQVFKEIGEKLPPVDGEQVFRPSLKPIEQAKGASEALKHGNKGPCRIIPDILA